MKEALYYHQTSKGVQCDLCPHECQFSDGQRGICGSRVCQEGKLYTLAYSNPCSLAFDPVEKKPLFHFHPGMRCFSIACPGCNFRCLNCQNFKISQAKPEEVLTANMEPETVVQQCIQTCSKAIAYTYTEPLTYLEYVADIARLAREKGILNILVSAGYVNPGPLADNIALFDAANIDLKSFSDSLYKKQNGGTLKPVLNALKAFKEADVWLEITNLLIPGQNDSPEMLREMCKWLCDNGFSDTPLHFSRYFPAYKMSEPSATPLKTLMEAKEIANGEGLKFVYIGNAEECDGEDTLCPDCCHTLVKRHVYTIHSNRLDSTALCPYCGTTIPGEWG